MLQSDWPLLSVAIWFPMIGGAFVLMVGDQAAEAAKRLGLAVALATFGITVLVAARFVPGVGEPQLVEATDWVAALGIEYRLGVDGFSLPLILLTSLTSVLVAVGAWDSIKHSPAKFMAALLVMTGLMIGVFLALDAILFYVFFEAMLIPMFLMIGIWGGPRRVYATIKFFLYTFLGSVMMLIALLYLGFKAGSFAVFDLHAVELGTVEQVLIFLAFFAAFAVKIPMWPVHTWLPDAHVEAPTGGSMVLAAIMLKIGGYGFIRFSMPIVPEGGAILATLVIGLSLVAIIYIAFVALAQEDMKRLIAYSSVAHMGFVTLGLFLVFPIIAAAGPSDHSALAVSGAMVQMVSHGFVSAALFFCVGVLYERRHSRMIGDYSGVARFMPAFAAFFVLFSMANAGLPGTSGFVGEFMVIVGAWAASPWISFAAATTLVLGAAYTLWLVKRVAFGAGSDEMGEALARPMSAREYVVLAALGAVVLGLGVWPAPLTDVMAPSVEHLLGHVNAKLGG